LQRAGAGRSLVQIQSPDQESPANPALLVVSDRTTGPIRVQVRFGPPVLGRVELVREGRTWSVVDAILGAVCGSSSARGSGSCGSSAMMGCGRPRGCSTAVECSASRSTVRACWPARAVAARW
jgi:hypothetical protein